MTTVYHRHAGAQAGAFFYTVEAVQSGLNVSAERRFYRVVMPYGLGTHAAIARLLNSVTGLNWSVLEVSADG